MEQIDLRNEAATVAFGGALASLLQAGDVIALTGPLGAGKTRLVQAAAAALGVDQQVTSPTFVLVHEYAGRLPVYHIDAYRLRDEDEFDALGPEEYFESGGIAFVEWADRVASSLPGERLEIAIETLDADKRRLTLCGRGVRGRELATALAGATE